MAAARAHLARTRSRLHPAVTLLHLRGRVAAHVFSRGSRLVVRSRQQVASAHARPEQPISRWTCRSSDRRRHHRARDRSELLAGRPQPAQRRSPPSGAADLQGGDQDDRPAGFLARQSSELPNGASNARSHSASRCMTAVMMALIGAGGTEISASASLSRRRPRRRWISRAIASAGNSVALRVGQPLDEEARPLQPRPQIGAAVAPDLPAQHGVVAAQHAHRRDVDDARSRPASAAGTSRRSPLLRPRRRANTGHRRK